MITMQDLGEYNLADENFLDVQSVADAMMTTSQSLTELAIRFLMNLAVCWVIVGPHSHGRAPIRLAESETA